MHVYMCVLFQYAFQDCSISFTVIRILMQIALNLEVTFGETIISQYLLYGGTIMVDLPSSIFFNFFSLLTHSLITEVSYLIGWIYS